jgi:hypothetical protein
MRSQDKKVPLSFPYLNVQPEPGRHQLFPPFLRGKVIRKYLAANCRFSILPSAPPGTAAKKFVEIFSLFFRVHLTEIQHEVFRVSRILFPLAGTLTTLSVFFFLLHQDAPFRFLQICQAMHCERNLQYPLGSVQAQHSSQYPWENF